jgi:hypothetical protein
VGVIAVPPSRGPVRRPTHQFVVPDGSAGDFAFISARPDVGTLKCSTHLGTWAETYPVTKLEPTPEPYPEDAFSYDEARAPRLDEQ